jgi:glycosyltransferase involved in cell wall biosynthesis
VPRVSVIIPAHNAAPFIEQALASVHAQTCADWEVLVVDDGSSDRTWELLQAAGPRVRSFRREGAGGPGVARNLALAHADSELVAFLDADDLWLPHYLQSQLDCYEAAVRRHPGGVGFVTCDARITIDGAYAPYTHLQRIRDSDRPMTLERVLRRNPVYTACLVPRKVGEEVGWFDSELFVAEDYGLWIKILEAGYRGVLNDAVLAVYRRSAGSVCSDIARLATNNRRAYELALGRGRLNARQRRIARRAIGYNRAMEQVARLRFAEAAPRLSQMPGPRDAARLAWVALRNPRLWPEWLELLRTGRAKDAPELRARP